MSAELESHAEGMRARQLASSRRWTYAGLFAVSVFVSFCTVQTWRAYGEFQSLEVAAQQELSNFEGEMKAILPFLTRAQLDQMTLAGKPYYLRLAEARQGVKVGRLVSIALAVVVVICIGALLSVRWLPRAAPMVVLLLTLLLLIAEVVAAIATHGGYDAWRLVGAEVGALLVAVIATHSGLQWRRASRSAKGCQAS